MAFSMEADPHAAQIQFFIDLSNEGYNKLDEIKNILRELKIEEFGTKKARDTLTRLNTVLDIFKTYGSEVERLKNENEVWRKSAILETINFMESPNQTICVRHPTSGIDLDHVKWPPDSSTGAHKN